MTVERHALTSGPTTGPDRAVVQGYLERHRETLLRICDGLDGEQLAARAVPPSALSLLGIVRHLTKVERVWLRQRVGGEDVPHLLGGPGDPTDFADADAARAAEDLAALRAEWRLADAAAAPVAWDHEVEFRGTPLSVGAVYGFLLGEYARHLGHADLLREVIDGVTGR